MPVRWQPLPLALVVAVLATLVVHAPSAVGAVGCTPRVSELPWPGPGFVTATAINDDGLAVGFTSDRTGRARALVWPPDAAEATVLPLVDARAEDVTDRGLVVGGSEEGAFTWRAGRARILPADPGARSVGAVAANDGGAVLGATYEDGTGTFAKVVWQDGSIVRRLAPPEGYRQNETSVADINDDGVVVGSAATSDGSSVAVRWPAGGGAARILPSLRGATRVHVDAVDAAGRVYGSSYLRQAGEWHATRWSATGAPRDLRDADLPAVEATAATDDGRMALDLLGARVAVLDPGQPSRVLPAPRNDPDGFSYSSGINGRGDVVGHQDSATDSRFGAGQALRWRCAFG